MGNGVWRKGVRSVRSTMYSVGMCMSLRTSWAVRPEASRFVPEAVNVKHFVYFAVCRSTPVW